MKNPFENYDENQFRLTNWLNTEEGKEAIRSFCLSPVPNYSKMFNDMKICIELPDGANDEGCIDCSKMFENVERIEPQEIPHPHDLTGIFYNIDYLKENKNIH